ncbi:hypothetical protein [Peribacillus simplex]|nr:hypothetical protein [Peribacillus simplex]
MEKHIDYLTKEIHRTEQKGFNEQHILDNEERELLLKWATENDSVDKYYDLLIQQFVHSSNFDTADHNYDVFIQPNLKQFNREQFLEIYDGIIRNRQCYAHRFGRLVLSL